MKNIYNAPNKEVAAAELDNLEKKWGGKYPYAILSWRNKWDDLTVMEIEKKWTQPIHNWGLIMNQFMLMFENRIQI